MSYYNINANALDEEELNYELSIRNCSVDGTLDTRRRTLRRAFREVEGPEVRESVRLLEDEFDVVPLKMQQIESQLQTGVESGSWSRLVHLHKRLRRYGTISQDQLIRKTALLDAVTRMAKIYFNVDLDEIGKTVPVMTLVPEGLALGTSHMEQPVEDQRSIVTPQLTAKVSREVVPNPYRLGTIPKKQPMRNSLIEFSPEPENTEIYGERRQTFPQMSGWSSGFAQPIQPVRASMLDAVPPRNPTDEARNEILGLGTPQYRTSVQVQIRRPSQIQPVPEDHPNSAEDSPQLRKPPVSSEQTRSYGAIGTEAKQYRPFNPCQHTVISPLSEMPGWPPRNISSGSLMNMPSYSISPLAPAVVASQPNPAENKANGDDYVHKSQIEEFIKKYLDQTHGRASCASMVNQPVTRTLADQFRSLQIKESNQRLTQVKPMDPHHRLSKVSLEPPLQLMRDPGVGTGPVGQTRIVTPSINGELSNLHNRSTSQHLHSDEYTTPRMPYNSQTAPFYPINTYRARLPHQTCNIIEKWPKFSGDSNPVPVVDFLRQLEILSRSYQITNSELRMHAHLLFKDDAYVWFTAYDSKMDTWETLLTYLKMRYDNPNRDRYLKEEMRSRKQRPNELFSAYLTDLEAMSQRMMRKMSDEEKFDIIVENMKMSYKRRLALEPVYSIEHLAQLCYKFDALEGNLYNSRASSRPHSLNQSR